MRDSSESSAYPNDVSSTMLLDAPNAASTPDLPTNPYDVAAAQARFDAALAKFSQAQAQAQAQAVDETATATETELAAASAALNRALGQSGHSWSLPTRKPPRVWTSRQHWLTSVASYLACGEGREQCKAGRLSPKTCLAVARAVARYADSSTGRSVTASNRSIGRLAARIVGRDKPYSHDVVAVARRVLAAAGFAVEVLQGRYLTAAERILARAHHGGQQIRAASVWALTSPSRSTGTDPKNPYLPSRSFTPREGSCRKYSPTRARKRTRAPFGRISPENRPLGAQVVAAQLVARVPSLDTKHIGAIVDVIVDTVDYTRWTGRDLVELMNVDARRRGVDWPAQIDKPAAFLRHRLQLLAIELAGPSPSEVAAAHAERIRAEQDARRQEHHDAQARAAKPDTVRSAMAEFRAMLAAKRETRRTTSRGD